MSPYRPTFRIIHSPARVLKARSRAASAKKLENINVLGDKEEQRALLSSEDQFIIIRQPPTCISFSLSLFFSRQRLLHSVARFSASDSAFLRPILYPSPRCSISPLVHDEIFLESNPWKGNCRPRACRASIGGLRERSPIKIAVWRSWRASSEEDHSPSPLCLFFLPFFFLSTLPFRANRPDGTPVHDLN